MFSSDKNVETIAQLVEVLKDYIGLQGEYLKLNVVEKTVRLLTALTLGVVLLILAVAALFYLSFAVVFWLTPYLGTGWAFCLMSFAFLLLLILVYSNRKTWIERPLVRFLADTLLN
jgi:hypothetical protein